MKPRGDPTVGCVGPFTYSTCPRRVVMPLPGPHDDLGVSGGWLLGAAVVGVEAAGMTVT